LSNDWYGTSRWFAKTFNSSSIPCGSRSQIVAVEGLRLGNTALTEEIGRYVLHHGAQDAVFDAA
jgi:hypothetical protein